MLKPRNTHYSKVDRVLIESGIIYVSRWYAACGVPARDWRTVLREYPVKPARIARLDFERVRKAMGVA